MSASSQPGEQDRAAELAARLAAMVRERTVAAGSAEIEDDDAAAPFHRLRALLETTYPAVFAAAEVEEVARHGLLLRIAGTGGSSDAGITGLGPCVLMAHQDVVPAPEQDWADAGWSHPPFDGVVATGADGELTVHGRGTLDDKGALLVLLEAVESLLAGGWRPGHDLYLLLGADEEREGVCAQEAASLLEERGVRPVLVLDEGGAVVVGAFPGVNEPVAVVGVAEKGYATLEISVSADPRSAGHASTPPRRGAAAGLGRAMNALERNPHPGVVDDVAVTLLETVAPLLTGPLRDVASRAGSLRPVLARLLPRLGGELAAMVRTTTCVTQLTGSSASNVIAARASAVVSMRVATTQSVAEAVAHVERVVQRAVHGRLGGLRRRRRGVLTASVVVVSASEPSPPSPMDERWERVSAAIARAYPDAVAAPYTMLAGSDSRFLVPLSEAVYRFAPLAMTARQRAGIHGVDEHVTADSLVRGVTFYRALLLGP